MSKKIIGIHAWEPGLFSTMPPTSSAGAQWWRHLIDTLSKDYMFVWANAQDAAAPEGFVHINKCSPKNWDLGVFAWRWLLAPVYTQRNVLYSQQNRLIKDCDNNSVPVLVLDHDDMITRDDYAGLCAIDAIITAPELNPHLGTKTLMFPDMLHTTLINPTLLSQRDFDLVYVGNNYDRFNQAVAYLSLAQLACPMKLWGNWLEGGPNRQLPEIVSMAFSAIKFGQRLPQDRVLTELSNGKTTIHLHKPSYGPIGFLSLRWYEAVCAGTPAWIPGEFYLPPEWQEKLAMAIVKDGYDLVNKLADLTITDYYGILNAQRDFCKQIFKTEAWLEMFDRLAK